MSVLQPGSTVLVWYTGDTVWHERLILGHISSSWYLIVTPDEDIYPQELSVPPLGYVMIMPNHRRVPNSLRARTTYRFEDGPRGVAYSTSQKRTLIDRAAEEVIAEREKRGLPPDGDIVVHDGGAVANLKLLYLTFTPDPQSQSPEAFYLPDHCLRIGKKGAQ